MLSVGCLAMACIALAVSGNEDGRELIPDTRFENGFTAFAPELGQKVPIGTLSWNDAQPDWGLAQWASRMPLDGSEGPIQPEPDKHVFENDAKRVVVTRPGEADALLTLDVNAEVEYIDGPREGHEPWVHLLIEQRMDAPPALPELERLDFQVEVRLRHCEKIPHDNYDPNRHAAQFVLFFTVQNLNRESSGYGDFYWFGVALFDDRGLSDDEWSMHDRGTDKLMYRAPRSVYTTDPMEPGRWVRYEADILPHVLAGLETAWELGYLGDSQDVADYHIGGMNMGWEIPGVFNAGMDARKLSLRAVMPVADQETARAPAWSCISNPNASIKGD